MQRMVALLHKEKKEWIPLDDEEIESIALKLNSSKRKSIGLTTYRIGELRTVFHELAASFGLRKYGNRRGMLAIQTNPYLFSYLILPKYTTIQINGRRFAYLLANGTIKNRNGRKVIGNIDFRDMSSPEILIGENNFGILNQPTKQAEKHERAVQLKRTMSEGIQELFVSVLLFYLIVKQTELEAFSVPTS